MIDIKNKIILASSSPRRRMLLNQVGLEFTVKTADIDETMDAHLLKTQGMDEALADVAHRKGAEVLRLMRLLEEKEWSNDIRIVSADTIVCMDGAVFGKPHDEDEAAFMLKRISGNRHFVKTGVCVIDGFTGGFVTGTQTTAVHISPISDEDILEYIRTGEPMDKAGAYAAQGIGARFVRGIEGCFYNVVGLPLGMMFDLFGKLEKLNEVENK